MTILDHHHQFMQQALQDAQTALDQGEFPVGCVLVSKNRVIARGRRHNSGGDGIVELDHAEIVALRNLEHSAQTVDMSKVTAYSTMEPCLMCYATLLLNGIRQIVYAYEDVMGGSTNLPLDQLAPLYRDLRVSVVPHVMRAESLALVKTFFSDPENNYWPDSLLARYTLGQP